MSAINADTRRQLETRLALTHRLLATHQLDAQDPDAATSAAEAMLDLGRLLLSLELFEPAKLCFENVLSLVPLDFRGPYLLGYTHHLEGSPEVALELYTRTLQLEPAYLPALVRQGRAHLALGQAELARDRFEQALALEATTATAHEGLGQVASGLGEHASAAQHFERALDLDPAASAIHYPLSQAYRKLGQTERAQTHFGRAGKVAVRLIDPLVAPPSDTAQSLQHHLLRGAELMEGRDYQAATEAFRAALRVESGNFSAYLGLAASLERLGDRAGARQTLEQALSSATTDNPATDRAERAEVLRSLGLLEAAAGNPDAAQSRFLASLELQPGQPDLLLRVANALARAGRFSEAVERYDQVLKQGPEWAAVALERRAAALANLGRQDEAIASFTRAVDAAPTDAQLRLRFAAALELFGDSEAAAAQRSTAAMLTEESTPSVATLYREARRLATAGDLAAALGQFEHALELDPRHLESRYGRAEALGRLGRFEEAVSELDRVIDEASTYLPAHRARLVALVLDERYSEARVSLQASLRVFPKHLGLALTQVRLLALAPDPTVRDPSLALELARRLHAADQESVTEVREALIVAHAAAGEMDNATSMQRELIEEAENRGDQQQAAQHRARLTDFEAGEALTRGVRQEILAALAVGARN